MLSEGLFVSAETEFLVTAMLTVILVRVTREEWTVEARRRSLRSRVECLTMARITLKSPAGN